MKQLHTIDLSFDKSRENNYLSNSLIHSISETLKKGEKTILYLNKRGNFSSYICKDCSHIYNCPNCDLSLNIHSAPERLMCHHCFHESALDSTCKNCHGIALIKVGVGTEQIEKSIRKLFTEASIYRFDTDNLRNISSKREALKKLANTDIIIGTKMITTGFNIKDVGLIGVILIEQELNIPRYNTEEQVYSNLRQLLGRGGRVGQQTSIILQTYAVNNPLIKSLTEKNYKEFFLETLSERKLFSYPPFAELVYIVYKHKEKEKSIHFINTLYKKFLQTGKNPGEITLVEKPIKRNNQYFTKIIIKGKDIRAFLTPYKQDILTNSALSVIFEG